MSVTEVAPGERRRFPRWQLQFDVDIEHLDSRSGTRGVSQDVSVGGIRLRADIGAEGPVFVVMGARGRVFATMGTVVMATAAGDGMMTEMRIRFDDRSSESAASLARFLDHLRSPSGPGEDGEDDEDDEDDGVDYGG